LKKFATFYFPVCYVVMADDRLADAVPFQPLAKPGWHESGLFSFMIAREVRSKTKRCSSRRSISARSAGFRHHSTASAHSALPDSYQSWLSDGASKEIGNFYRA
jgi:hypothetical protein